MTDKAIPLPLPDIAESEIKAVASVLRSGRLVLTDSGGIQEETTILKVPCLTLRENTERPVTAEIDSNTVVGTNPERILAAYRDIVEGRGRKPLTPPLWDGHAAERIAEILLERL